MFRRAIGGALVALVFVASTAVAETAVKSVAAIVGKWQGVSSSGTKYLLEIKPDGKFTLETTRGNDAAMAKIDGGALIIPFSDKQGQMTLKLDGDALSGTSHWKTFNATIRLTRQR